MKASYSPNVHFNQSEMMDFLYTDGATSLINKIASVSLSKECYSGFCYGLARKYLYNQENASNCIRDINCYIRGIPFMKNSVYSDNKRTSTQKIITEKELNIFLSMILERVRFKNGKKNMAEAIELHTLHYKNNASFMLNRPVELLSKEIPAAQFLDKLKIVNDINKDICLETIMEKSPDFYFNEKQYYNEVNSDNKKAVERLYNRVFLKKQSKEEQYDEFLNSAASQIKTKLDIEKAYFNNYDVCLFLQVNDLSESKKIASEFMRLDDENGVEKSWERKRTLSDFLSDLRHTTELNGAYLTCSENHAMALNTNFTDKKEEISFFDPNEGIYTFNNLNEFSAFLPDFIKTHPEYKFAETETDYTFNIEKYSRVITQQDYSNDFRNHLTKEWRKKQISLKVKEGDDSVITPVSFNTSTGLFEMAYHNNQISGRIYTFQPDIKVIHAFLKDNMELLQKDKAVYFIDIMSEVYQIEDEKLISQLNYHSNPKALFGSPIPLW